MTVGLGRRKWLVACIFGGGLLPCIVWANPSGGSVAHGKAEFSKPSGKALHITTDKHTIINWEKFSIEAGEYTQFFQPGKDSAVLNRVTGKEASRILGKLLANGKVYLVNPQGVIVGKEGMINTGGFLASALDISDADFLNGEHMRFHGDSRNGIKNQGTIKAASGDLILIGYTVDNEGLLEAPEGKVALGAGLDILVKPKEAEKLFIRPEVAQDRAEVGIDNKGVIAALESELQADGNLYSKAVRHSGTISASKAVNRGGRVFLVADRGETEVSGTVRAPEGEVQILGETVALKTGALLDVSGDESAGKVFVGGGFRGQDPELIRSQSTLVEEGAALLADARVQGDGGQIVVWSDGATQFYGEASAQGGSAQGDGGLVEVSGLGFLGYHGRANTLAQNGNTGTLLLDPTNFNFPSIDANYAFFTSPGMIQYQPNGSGLTALISSATLDAALVSNNVIIETRSVPEGTQNGSISMLDTYTYTSPHSFTLNAAGEINITAAGAALINSGTGDIVLNAVGGINITGPDLISPVVSTGGNISAMAGGDIAIQTSLMTSGGNFNLTAGKSVTASNSQFNATGQLTIVADTNFGCGVGNGAIDIRNSVLTGAGSILLFAAQPAGVIMTGTTLNGVPYSESTHFGVCFFSAAGQSRDPNFTVYYKQPLAPTTASQNSAVQQTNQSTAVASGSAYDDNSFAFASPRTLWILLLALGRRVRRSLARIFNFLRRTTCA